MSYGADNYVNNKVGALVLSFFDSFTARYYKKRRMWSPIVFIAALDKIGIDVKNQSADF